MTINLATTPHLNMPLRDSSLRELIRAKINASDEYRTTFYTDTREWSAEDRIDHELKIMAARKRMTDAAIALDEAERANANV